MGKKAKTSRKGKKAWRANISTADIEEHYEKSTKDALSGGSLAAVPSESLFFIDKSADLSVKRKIEKHREKVLRCDSVLQRSPFVPAIPSSKLKKPKKKNKDVSKIEVENQDAPKDDKDSASDMVDLWGDKGDKNVNSKQKSKSSLIPAVEIEPPGCSYNPSFEAHQDSLARAVAEEMQKVYQNELAPQPVPLTVTGEVVDEEDMYLLDVDAGDDDDLDEENTVENSEVTAEQSSKRPKRVTRVEFNKRLRRKEQLKSETEAKKTEGLSKEIDSIEDIIKEIAKEDEEKGKRHVRRAIAKQERMKSAPPRLGKNK
ncbi:hypothetical protein GIB67_004413 [Kingdonia uniflora]|uniref:Ribosome biogenesis protein NOP53 n=1 Tax=Kingdonia uniflora TaxID=39325 RepID=A0A7J7MRD5_9MAGN|nr:hypothetical protein GIB67_004413 [Kingdonia uniflora]